MKKTILILLLFISFCSCSLNSCNSADSGRKQLKPESLSFVCWNVQTFFDAETDGCEYSEFRKSSTWTKEKYLKRLQSLCEVICELNADIYVFEEIENQAILYDISNQLSGKKWNTKNKWNYACFTKNEKSSIGCCVISKYPLFNLKTHNVDVRVLNEKQPEMRPLMEVTVCVNDYNLNLFVAHWKSKVGGTEKTEIWRDWQEGILGRCLLEKDNNATVICGDFNRDIRDFVLIPASVGSELNTVIRAVAGEKNVGEVEVYSPWLLENGSYSTENGSYWYDKKWERIDQIFSSGNVRISGFSPRAEEPWANEDGMPLEYKVYTGEGYSDHLPLMCTLILSNKE